MIETAFKLAEQIGPNKNHQWISWTSQGWIYKFGFTHRSSPLRSMAEHIRTDTLRRSYDPRSNRADLHSLAHIG